MKWFRDKFGVPKVEAASPVEAPQEDENQVLEKSDEEEHGRKKKANKVGFRDRKVKLYLFLPSTSTSNHQHAYISI